MPNPTPGRPHPFTAAPAAAPPLVTATGTVTTVEDVRREFYDTADWSAWITEVQVGPAGLALIVMDDDTGQLSRIPVVTGTGGQVTFGPATPVLVDYVPAPQSPPSAPPGQPAAAGRPPAYPPGRRIAAAWATRAASRAGQPATARPGRTGLAALAWVARHGHAAASNEATWTALFGKHPGPDPDAADRREATPMTEREYEALYGDGPAPADPGPPIPELAGYHPGVKFTAPPGAPGPQLDIASAGRVAGGVQSAPQIGQLGIVEHGEIDGGAWHSHAHGHPGSEADGHTHEHVHQPGAGGLHAIGPGHNHDAPAEYVPELASRAARGKPGARLHPAASRPYVHVHRRRAGPLG